jgi:predicted GIY-YIG superfamily endonuclease
VSFEKLFSLESEIYDLEREIQKLERERKKLFREIDAAKAMKKMTGGLLVSKESILAAANDVEKTSGVYFLINDEEIVYVGQSVNIHSRIHDHTSSNGMRKKFNKFAFVCCNEDELDAVESVYIHMLQPKDNATKPNNEEKVAPFSFKQIMEFVKNEAKTLPAPRDRRPVQMV